MIPLAPPAHVQAAPSAKAEIEALLKAFLEGMSRNDTSVHRTFWADDLIYTGSSGRRLGKADILKDSATGPAPKPEDPKSTYSAEEVQIHVYGETAVLAFRLVARTEDKGQVTVQRYLNTGVFVRRDGRWQAVAWQATKAAEPKP